MSELNTSDVQWDDQGRPYRIDRYSNQRSYVSPAEILPAADAGYTVDPKVLAWARGTTKPTGGVFHSAGQWNPHSGQWEQKINGGNLMAMGIGGLFAGPAIAGALAGSGGAGAAAAGEAAGTSGAAGAGTAAASGLLPATSTVSSLGSLATGVPSLGGNMGWGSFLTGLAKDQIEGTAQDYVKGKLQNQAPHTSQLEDVGKVLGAGAQGAASGRLQQALYELQRAHEEASRFGQQSSNAQNQATFGLNAPNVRAGQAVRGDILANMQDVNIQAPSGIQMGTVTGGLRPSMLSDSTREFGRNLTKNALASQMNGGEKIDYPTMPAMPETPSASGLDKAMSYGSTAAGLTSALLGDNAGKYATLLFGHPTETGADPNQFVGPTDSRGGTQMTGNLFGQNAGDYGIGQTQDPDQAYQDWLKAQGVNG